MYVSRCQVTIGMSIRNGTGIKTIAQLVGDGSPDLSRRLVVALSDSSKEESTFTRRIPLEDHDEYEV